MLTEHRCPKCGKLFFPAPYHMYKDKANIYCSWTCYNHRNDGRKERKLKVVEQCTKSGEVVRTFSSVKQAALYMDGTIDAVYSACRNNKIYKGYLWRYKK